MTDLRDILVRTGGDVYENGRRALIPGPGHSPRDRSLSLEQQADGRIVYFAHCGHGHGHAEIMGYLGLEGFQAQEVRPTERLRQRSERSDATELARAEKIVICQALWRETRPLQGTLAVKYLRGRAITFSSTPAVLRYHPRAPRAYPTAEKPNPRRAPAMVAMVQDYRGQGCGLHLTFLKPDGSGHDGRIMLGAIANAAVRLATPGEELAIAEGIETAASYMDLQGRPCWSLLSTSQFTHFRPPHGVKRLYVAPDMDDKLGSSLKLSEALVGRFRDCQVIIDAPPAGTDWNSHARRIAG